MQITEWEMYWLLKLDGIKGFFIFISIVIGLIALVSFVSFIVLCIPGKEGPETIKRVKRWSTVSICLSVIFIPVAILIPDTKQMIAIKVVPRLANSQFMQEDLPADVREVYEATKRKFLEMAGPEKKGK